IQSQRKNDSLVLIDIAVPRDIEPGIDTHQDVFNYDVDDLKGLVDANLKQRQNAADEILQRIPAEIEAHNEWVNMLGVVPVIRALREKAMDIQEDTMSSIDRKLPGLTERERKIISKHTKSIINQMLKDPIKQAKELSSDKKSNEKLELFQNIFDMKTEQDYKKKKKKRKIATTSQIFSFDLSYLHCVFYFLVYRLVQLKYQKCFEIALIFQNIFDIEAEQAYKPKKKKRN